MGLHCCTGSSLVAASGAYFLAAVCGLLTALASLVAHRLEVGRLQELWLVGSTVVAHGLALQHVESSWTRA